ncbi:MAG: 4'-phosphopantetheinyl transferase family protein [Gammaproteobacteria bacterium]
MTADQPHSLDIWLGRLSLRPANFSRYWGLLDAAEKSRALGIPNPLRQQRYVETQGRLRIILGEAVAAAPERLMIAKMAHGKPYLADYPAVAFNLSHTGDQVAIALGRQCRVGIDIESCKPRANMPALVEKCFGAPEVDYWCGLPEDRQLLAFYRFWTRKEAFVKAIGQGLSLGVQRCVIDPANPDRMLSVPASCGKAGDWSLYSIAQDDAICGAVAVDRPMNVVRVNALDED